MNTKSRFVEPVPENCPPNGAVEPNELTVFRLINGNQPQQRDFDPHVKVYPDKYQKNNCRAHSLSVFTNRDSLTRLFDLPVHKNKRVGRIVLIQQSGVIMQSGNDETHLSWWRYHGFDAVSACEVTE
jgi:hypothetical protein